MVNILDMAADGLDAAEKFCRENDPFFDSDYGSVVFKKLADLGSTMVYEDPKENVKAVAITYSGWSELLQEYGIMCELLVIRKDLPGYRIIRRMIEQAKRSFPQGKFLTFVRRRHQETAVVYWFGGK